MLRLLFALNIEQVFDRRAFSGIAGASRHYADMLFHQKEPSETFQQAVHRYGINGIILSSDDSRFVKEAFETGKPCVNIANHLSDQYRVPVVGTDDAAIGELVAQHYIDRGFRNFAFYANLRLNYFFPRQQAFVKAVEKAGYQCAIGPMAIKRSGKSRKKPKYDQSEWVEHAGRWLASLPQPLGLMAPHDSYARDAVQVCHVAGKLVITA